MKSAVIVFLLSLVATSASAQTALPFTTRPVSKAEFIKAIENCDQKVLYIKNCAKIVDAANIVWKDDEAIPQFENRKELADYLRRLTVAPCPQVGEATVARVLKNGAIDLYGYKRDLRRGESCLYDNQAGKWIASLSCGNFITKEGLPVFTAMRDEAEPRPSIRQQADEQAREAAKTTKPAPKLEPEGKGFRIPGLSPIGGWAKRHPVWATTLATAGAAGGWCVATRCWEVEDEGDVYNTNRTNIYLAVPGFSFGFGKK